MTQLSLFTQRAPRKPRFHFDGATFDPAKDTARLTTQMLRVCAFMTDGKWRTLREIGEAVEAPEASVSARLRDLRKPRFGGFTVDRRRRGVEDKGLFEYRVAFAWQIAHSGLGFTPMEVARA